jgi:uncharacterized coiled-coil protein SlyX
LKDLETKIACTIRNIDRVNRRKGLYSLEAQRLQDLLEMLKDELAEIQNDANGQDNP